MTDWKMQDTRRFGILNKVFSEFHNPSEHVAADKYAVLFKGSIVFKQYIQNGTNSSA
jgi:hypothetical protein